MASISFSFCVPEGMLGNVQDFNRDSFKEHRSYFENFVLPEKYSRCKSGAFYNKENLSKF